MHFSIETPDEFLSRNGAEAASADGSAIALYYASGALVGGTAPALNAGRGDNTDGINGVVSAGSAESDEQNSRLSAEAMDGEPLRFDSNRREA